MIRSLLATAVTAVTAVSIAVVSASAPAALAAPGQPDRAAGVPAAPGQVSAPPGARARTGAIAAGLHPDLSGATLSSAASRCARWAGKAGFANNGYLGGSLTTAVAVALAESGCNPGACYNDTTRRECTRAGTSGSRDSIDRGAWQINSSAWRSVSNSCAYRGLCNARAAYRQVSAYGTYFAPWTVYLTDNFARYLWAAQRAVSALHRGTITSALIGSCAAHPAGGRAGQVVLANCGSSAAVQQWRKAGGAYHSGGGRCLTGPRRRARAVTVAHCSGSRRQDWRTHPGSTLYNVGSRLCLTDAGSSLRPGRVLTTGSCAWHQNQAWFRPTRA